ncbi:MAG TPA: RDD family protein [Thiolapillus brandeum]|uniref:RDD family protein n=1 Tax=Thiolapillus brandeum TaxID=1076588 RepID=A0A831NVX6_9GAMM|nr:RDD family protein [Thiolapillus brandeum]
MNETPFNLENAVEPGLFRRLAAIIYDSVLVAALVAAAFTLVYLPLATGFGLENLNDYPWYRLAMTLWMFTVGIGFHLWFWTHGGQTLGMRAWRLMLFSNDGRSPSMKQAIIRYAIAVVSLTALGLGFLWVLIDPQKRTWHDIASGTRLVLVDPNIT